MYMSNIDSTLQKINHVMTLKAIIGSQKVTNLLDWIKGPFIELTEDEINRFITEWEYCLAQQCKPSSQLFLW